MTNIPEANAPETDKLLSFAKGDGGARRSRTDDLLNANQALSQLSYGPVNPGFPPGRMPCPALPQVSMVGRGRVELPTSRLSGVRSNHLSYRPVTTQGQAHRGLSRRQA